MNLEDKKLELTYPTNWKYKIITSSHDDALLALEEVFGSREYKYNKSNNSKSGKFISFNIELLVHSDDDRVGLYTLLNQHKRIKYVL